MLLTVVQLLCDVVEQTTTLTIGTLATTTPLGAGACATVSAAAFAPGDAITCEIDVLP
jgi:hypothetical protein